MFRYQRLNMPKCRNFVVTNLAKSPLIRGREKAPLCVVITSVMVSIAFFKAQHFYAHNLTQDARHSDPPCAPPVTIRAMHLILGIRLKELVML